MRFEVRTFASAKVTCHRLARGVHDGLMPEAQVLTTVVVMVIAGALFARKRSSGSLPSLRFWVACLIGVVAVTLGTLSHVSGVLLTAPVVFAGIFAVMHGGWKIGDSGLFLILLGIGMAVAYVVAAAFDPNTGSATDQGAVYLVIMGVILCVAAVGWTWIRFARGRSNQ